MTAAEVPRRYGTDAPGDVTSVYAKVTWRIVPILFACYVLSYLDRINVGFAQLQMKSDLGFSDAVYGLGAGIFFLGYFLFEVPSNLLLEKIGARLTITRIMVIWGLVSAGMAFVNAPWLFYVMRFFLGVFEAGFFPGIILYFTYWYPGAYRCRIIAIFMSGIAVAGVIGGPLSGYIMRDMVGVLGLKGWQWMFVIEGLPTTLLGIFIFFYLDDRPDAAKWLTDEEKAFIRRNLENEHGLGEHTHDLKAVWLAFKDPKVYVLSLAYFCFICGVYMISFWLPTLIKELGIKDPLHVGLLAAIPYSVTTVGMIAIGIHSDRTLERRWHCAIPAFVGAAALIGVMYAPNIVMTFVMLSVASLGIITTMPLFWAIPTAYLKGATAAGGIALINSLGLIGGFVSPAVLGWIKTSTHSLNLGFWGMAAVMTIGGLLILVAVRPGMLKEAQV